MPGPPPAVPSPGSARAVSQLVGMALFVALTVVVAGVVGAATLQARPAEPGPRAALTLAVDAGTDRLALAHEGGDQLAVADLRVRVSVDGVPLAHQPPVPFFVARGFRAGPTGPFNVASDGIWSAGETAGVRVASTNEPTLEPGVAVRVRIYAGDRPVADLTERA